MTHAIPRRAFAPFLVAAFVLGLLAACDTAATPTVIPLPTAVITGLPAPLPSAVAAHMADLTATPTPEPPPIPIPQNWAELAAWLYAGGLGLFGTFFIDWIITGLVALLHRALTENEQRLVSVAFPIVGVLLGYGLQLLLGAVLFTPDTLFSAIIQALSVAGLIHAIYTARPVARQQA